MNNRDLLTPQSPTSLIPAGKSDSQPSETSADSSQLRQLVQQLRTSQADLEARQFVETNAALLAGHMRWQPEDTLAAWAERVLEELVRILEGLRASLYLRSVGEDGSPVLKLAGVCAGTPEAVAHQVRFGEGLLGQAAKSARMLYFKDEVLTEATCYTGLAEVLPKALLLQPLVYHDVVEGVLELAASHPFSDQQLDLLRRVSEGLAASMMGIRNQEEMKRLVKEAQEKSEQLHTQEEEMRQNLEELQTTQEELNRRIFLAEEANQQIEAILNASIDPIIALDSQGKVLIFNRAACRTFGFCEEEVVGRPIQMLMPEAEDAHQVWMQPTGDSRAEGQVREIEVRRKDGARFPATLAVNEIEHAGERMFVAVLQDITQKKQREAELAEHISIQEMIQEELQLQHDLYAAMLDSSHDTFVALDREYRLLLMNQQMRLNYEKANMFPKVGESIFIIHPPDQHEMFMGFYTRVLSGETFHRLIDIPEKNILLRGTYFPLRNVMGEIFGIGVVGTDLMEVRKMLEEGK